MFTHTHIHIEIVVVWVYRYNGKCIDMINTILLIKDTEG